MKRSRSAKCLFAGVVLTASALVAELDCQARQSNVYSISVPSFSERQAALRSPHIHLYAVEREWGIKAWTNWQGLQMVGLRQWGGGEQYGSNFALISGRKVYTEVALGSLSFKINLSLIPSAVVLGVALLLMVWATIACAIWLLNKRARRDVQIAQESIRPP
jgi:hypothetical protein